MTLIDLWLLKEPFCFSRPMTTRSEACVLCITHREDHINVNTLAAVVRQTSLRSRTSLLRSRSGRSHVTLLVPTRLLQTDIHSFLGVLRFCLLGPMSLSFSCHCIRCTNHRREHSQQNESHTLIGLFPRKECMSV